MRTKYQTIQTLRSTFRWATGIALTATIIGGSCILFPALTGSFTAMSLTCALAGIIGLSVALPPLDPEDDWVPFGKHTYDYEKNVEQVETVEKKPASKPVEQPATKRPGKTVLLPPIDVQAARLTQVLHSKESANAHRLSTRHHHLTRLHKRVRSSNLKHLYQMGFGKAANTKKLSKN
jgi:hypothetical protein